MRIPAAIVNAITWLCRVAVGLTFCFSGFVKAVDPWGTLYKFADYLAAFQFSVNDNLLLIGVFGLCGVEFLIGMFLLLGCFRRVTPWLLILMMLIMLPLTLWIAVSNPVSDCGCFGEALLLSNWATFWKNVVITLCGVWLLIYNYRSRWLVTPALQWVAAAGGAAYILVIGCWGYLVQPVIDFRGFPTGTLLGVDSAEPDFEDDGSDMLFVYAKDGKEKTFGIDDELPDEEDGWVFVRREQKEANASAEKRSNLVVFDADGEEDMTTEAITRNNPEYLLLIPEMTKLSPQLFSYQVNSIAADAQKQGIGMVAIVGGDRAEIERYEDLAMPSYPIYTADDTQIKELARGNPALVYLEDGKVKSKVSLEGLAMIDSPEAMTDMDSISRPFLYASTITLFILVVVLVFSSFIPIIYRLPKRMKKTFKREEKVDNGDSE